MSVDSIDKLYKNYEILSAATDKSLVSFFSPSRVVASLDNLPGVALVLCSRCKLNFA